MGSRLLGTALGSLTVPRLPPNLSPTLVPGPFTTQEMAEWFQAGYFSMSLLVKRGCDEGFQPLGEVIKMWGRVPFAPGPSPPPLLVSTVCSAGCREGQWGQQQDLRLPPPPRVVGMLLLGTLTQACSDLLQGNMDQERLKKQQELAAAALYQQLQHQHFLQLVGRYGELQGSLWVRQGSWVVHL